MRRSARLTRGLTMAVTVVLAGGVACEQVSSPSTGTSTPVSEGSCTVEHVIDGDTVVCDGRRVRVVGIDTPEVAGHGEPGECHAAEAASAMRRMVDGHTVRASVDPSQGDTDRYGRLLRYLRTDSTPDVGERMLREGHARLYQAADHPRRSTYEAAARSAREAGEGLWSTCASNGNP